MDFQPLFHGFLASMVVLAIEHLTIYPLLRPKGDAGVLGRFVLGVLAILAGCGIITWETGEPLAVIAPIACSAGGLVVLFGYVVRWLWQQAKEAAYTRGRLHGLADQGDIEEDGR